MVLGQLLPRRHFEAVGARLPGVLAGVGRYPLTWYAGHLLVFEWMRYFGVFGA
jgi:hypothetical protein